MMRRLFRCLLLSIVALTPLFEKGVGAQSSDVAISPESLTELWSDLLESESTATRAVLKLSRHPESVTKFLATKLLPLKLDEQELHETIADLGSDDEKRWRAAFQKLNYFDPRLALGIEEILSIDSVQDYPARQRLVDVLSGRTVDGPYSAMGYKTITLSKIEGDDGAYYNFFGRESENSCGSSWWAESKVEKLNSGFSNQRVEWTRIVRALAVLESFNTSEATAIIESIATGHAQAQPTRVAREILSERIEN
jgi:hypothetical protein